MKISIKHDLDRLTKTLTQIEREQIPFATAVALTKTAQKVQAATVNEMRTKFDRATPYTLKSLRVQPATKRNLSAAVFLKDQTFGKNRLSMAQIIGHQFAGGGRATKAIEYWLMRSGLISDGEFVAPGEGAKLDRYGNMSRGQIIQILSQLKIHPDPYAFKSKSAASKRSVKKAGTLFWSRGGRLPRGVWIRAGDGVRPILIVVRRPHYKRLIDMERIAKQVVRAELDGEFSAAIENALRTAR